MPDAGKIGQQFFAPNRHGLLLCFGPRYEVPLVTAPPPDPTPQAATPPPHPDRAALEAAILQKLQEVADRGENPQAYLLRAVLGPEFSAGEEIQAILARLRDQSTRLHTLSMVALALAGEFGGLTPEQQDYWRERGRDLVSDEVLAHPGTPLAAVLELLFGALLTTAMQQERREDAEAEAADRAAGTTDHFLPRGT
jgi:hypothetical protein